MSVVQFPSGIFLFEEVLWYAVWSVDFRPACVQNYLNVSSYDSGDSLHSYWGCCNILICWFTLCVSSCKVLICAVSVYTRLIWHNQPLYTLCPWWGKSALLAHGGKTERFTYWGKTKQIRAYLQLTHLNLTIFFRCL